MLVGYVISAWVILQVADVVVPALELPGQTVGVLVWVAILGLPVAAVLAWLFQVTSEGIRKDPPAETPPETDALRLIVLPFRVLRSDPETDFLAFSLPDAITCNLAGLRSLVVRSSIAAGRYENDPDLKVLSEEARVDVVLTGTLLRAGGEVEVRTQLTQTRDGTLLWSQTSRVPVDGLFGLQEQVTRRIASSLALPLSAGEERRLHREARPSPRAYELYLRANQLSVQVSQWSTARDLYLECLAEDPEYAPAWARAARCHRLLAKYALAPEAAKAELAHAEAAFRRALKLNPDLPLAHSLYADLEVDTDRAEQAMVRLLARLEVDGHHVDLLSGLVQACRFCGLLEASKAADRRARDLDPLVRTSVSHSHFMAGDYEAALAACNDADIGYMEAAALVALGRTGDALDRLHTREAATPKNSLVGLFIGSLRALLEGDREESLSHLRRGAALQRDGEGIYYVSRQLAFMGAHDEAIAGLERSLACGFFCHPAVVRDPWLDGVRDRPAFQDFLGRVRDRHERAVATFEVSGGPRLLLLAGDDDSPASPVRLLDREGAER